MVIDTHANIIQSCKTLNLQLDCVSSGPITAEIAIVSDYPEGVESRTKLPFSGAAGTFLWKQLSRYGITRYNVYTTNIIKRTVATRNNGVLQGEKVRKSELELWKSILETELGMLPNLKYILVLGGHALEGLCGKLGINNWRGSVLEWNQTKILCTFNPAYVLEKEAQTNQLKDPIRQVIFNFDLGKFASLLGGGYEEVITKTHVTRTLCDVRHVFNECRKASVTSLDIEHLNNETVCIGFATDTRNGYVIPFYDTTRNLWTVEEELWIRDELSRLLKTIKVIGQNISSDLCWLWYKDRIRIHNVAGDTLLAHHLLYPTLPHNLGFLTSQYTWQPFYKDDGKTWHGKDDIEKFWEYNAKDTTFTLRIHKKLLVALANSNLLDIYNNHIIRILPHLCKATVVGIDIDKKKKAVLDRYYTTRFEKKKKELIALATPALEAVAETKADFNPSSSAQVAELLYTVYKCPTDRRNSTDITSLEKLLAMRSVSEEAKKFIKLLKDYRKDQKFLSTYVRTPIDDDGKFRAHYYQFGTRSAPGRLSSGHNQWGTASNIQNQPYLSRQMFVCPEGWSFVYIDLAQAEARFVGFDANIAKWKAEFADTSICMHRALASRIFEVPYDEVPVKDQLEDGTPTIRFYGKKARHGLNYRMQPQTFAEDCKIKRSMAQTIYTAYHRDTPEIQKWWKRLEAEVKASKAKTGLGILYNSLGRRLAILEPLDDNTLKSIIAFRPQSTIGDWLQRVWYLCHDDPEWPTDALILLNVHDSLTAICRDSCIPTVAKLLVHYAQQPIDVNGEELCIPADCKVSVADKKGIHRWSTLKGYKV